LPGRPAQGGAVRVRYADRSQVAMQLCSLDELVPADHPARVIWQAVCELDLTRFEEPIAARQGVAGRPANDVRVMTGLWLWAAVQGVGSGRELAELCEDHVIFRWMCGGLSMNYHTLNDFRVGHGQALDELFTQVLGRLMHQKLVSVERITQDGMRTRASAGTSSFKRAAKLQDFLKQAQEHLQEVKQQQDLSPAEAHSRRESARRFAAEDRVRRVQEAMEALKEVDEAKKQQSNKKKREAESRASVTDPDARTMKMPNSGFNPAYNLQVASDPQSRAIVGVQVSQSGGDAPLAEPMRQQVNQRAAACGAEQKVIEHVLDGGYVNLDGIDRAAVDGVTLYMPVPARPDKDADRFERRKGDSDAVAAWRQRMGTDAGKQVYQQRGSTCETINADLSTHRNLKRFLVRGLGKVQCVALWVALAYNLMHFGSALISA
jgi:transposase